MFDFSLTEMMLAGVVALIVLGPERLPIVARKAGEWVGKIQSLAAGVKNELAANTEVAELTKVKQDLQNAAADIKQDLQDLGKQVEQETRAIAAGMQPENVPAWERLPEQKTPADFGVNESGTPLATVSAPESSLKAAPAWQSQTLRKQAMSRRRDMRPRHRPTPKLRSRR